jgi:hypothetical protein
VLQKTIALITDLDDLDDPAERKQLIRLRVAELTPMEPD